MTQYHACVWIDHREAKIFSIEAKSAEEIVLHDSHAPKHIHRKADQVGLGKAPPETVTVTAPSAAASAAAAGNNGGTP